MKKLICLAIAALMLLSLIPLQAVAANGVTEQSDTSVCYIDGATKTYYDFVRDAVNAVPDGGTATIVMVKNTVETGYIQPFGKNITIDGKGFTITRTGAAYVFDVNRTKNGGSADWAFTLKDAKVVGTHGIWFDTNEINIINCEFDISTELGISAAPASEAVVNIVDTVWNQRTICFAKTGNGNSANITFNIENSTISVTPAFRNDVPTAQNNGVFNAHQKTNLSVNLDETSKIIANGPRCGGIFSMHNAESLFTANFNLTLAEGALLELNNCASNAAFIDNAERTTVNIVDNGATWKADAASVNKGVRLPSVSSWVWAANGSDVVDNTYMNPTATTDVVFTHKIGTPDTTPAVKTVDAEGNTVATYSNLRDAFNAMKGGTTAAVKAIVLKSHKLPGTLSATYNADGAYKFVVEGITREDGTEPLISTSAGFADTLSLWDLTMTNVNVVNTHGSNEMFMFDVYYDKGWKDVFNGAHVEINDCDLYNYSGSVFKCRAGASSAVEHDPFYIDIEDSYVYNSGAGNFIKAFYNADVKLNVKDSNIQHNATGYLLLTDTLNESTGSNLDFVADNTYIGANNANPLTLTAEKSASSMSVTLKNGTEIDMKSTVGSMWYAYVFANEPGADGKFSLYVDGTSSVMADFPSSGTRAGLITAMSGKHTVVFEKGATVGINGKAADMWFLQGSASLYDFTDNGANYVVGETVATSANGLQLPTTTGKDTVVGYHCGDMLYKSNVTKAAGTYNVVSFDSSDFAMQNGAALRTVWQENGIRFTTEISADLYNALKDNAVFGTVIAPNVEGANPNAYEGDKLDIVATKTQAVEDKVVIRAAVLMPETVEAYKLQLAANAYFTVTYADGTTATFNTAFGAENVRSMFDVATNLKAQGNTNAAVEAILTACAE